MGRIVEHLARDQRRLDRLLARADRDQRAYQRFGAGLLRRIAMEERVLLPAARRANGGEPVAEAEQLRIDHARLAALLVPSPSGRTLEALRTLLGPHDRLEMRVYEACEQLIGPDDCAHVLTAMRAQPAIAVRR